MNAPTLRRPLLVYLLALAPVMGLAAGYAPYMMDGDSVAYMDIADLLHAHRWADAVNAYWHPLYPALLSVAQGLAHPSRANELGVYYAVNFAVFFAQVAAMLWFVTALVRLREAMGAAPAVLSLNALRLLGVALLVIAAQRELTLDRVGPDGLLQALILAGLAMLLQALATDRLIFVPLMGLFFGLAYLTKSFAFLLALLAIAVLVVFQWRAQRRPLWRAVASGLLALVVFAAVAGPYVTALSRQKHRFDFGDSGSLNYAWYVGGTEKMHLEPWMTKEFGAAKVELVHPEKQLLALQGAPGAGIYSYKGHALGTYPAWFDATYFNERIVPHIELGQLAKRDSRNAVLAVRYLLNHPEPLILLALLLCAGARLRLRETTFWWPAVGLGLAMWAIYGLVNIEERYVTVAYFAVLLPLFAALEVRAESGSRGDGLLPASALRSGAGVLVVLLAFLALGETLRVALQERREQSVAGLAHGWRDPEIFRAAEGLRALGVRPGDEIACVGTKACLDDHYWARLAGVQILTEMYEPDPKHLIDQLDTLPNREQAYDVVRAQGAKVLVGHFDPGEMNAAHPASAGWVRLGETAFYALPLNLPGGVSR
jgi:4-amino-4-deoxy-L-arabinose transferase-like glycosyltransferase